MNCPNCVDQALASKLTRQGVEIDKCVNCGGVWLDEGEIFHFTKQPTALARALDRCRSQSRPCLRVGDRRLCPYLRSCLEPPKVSFRTPNDNHLI